MQKATLPTELFEAPELADVSLDRPYDRSLLPEVATNEGRPLDDDSVDLLIKLVAAACSNFAAEEPLRQAIAHCERASLAEFGWALSRQADEAHGPGFYMTYACGWFGNDETVARIAMSLGEGPWDSIISAMVLRVIGTDYAKWTLARRALHQEDYYVRTQAHDQLRRLTLEPMEDIWFGLAHDLGLDAEGRLALEDVVVEVGPDLQLHALSDGQQIDATALSEASAERVERLRFEWEQHALVEGWMLEEAMVKGRRWAPDEFRRYLATPPHRALARGVIWGAYHKGELQQSFRVEADSTYADVSDELSELPDKCDIGIVHPAELPELRSEWQQVLIDYEIVQPFDQIQRELFDRDAAIEVVCGVVGKRFPADRMRSLRVLGWQRVIKGSFRKFVGYQRDFGGDDYIRIEVREFWADNAAHAEIERLRKWKVPDVTKKHAKVPTAQLSELAVALRALLEGTLEEAALPSGRPVLHTIEL